MSQSRRDALQKSMARRGVRTAVVSCPQTYAWQSLNHILPAIDRAWEASASAGHLVNLVRLPAASPAKFMFELLCDRVVFPQFTMLEKASCDIVRVLRHELRSDASFIFHLHGDGTKAAAAFEGIKDLLRTTDGFIAASEADSRAFRLCYPTAKVMVAPFALAERPASPRRSPFRSARLWYCGRISEQKNLHVLLLAIHLARTAFGRDDIGLEVFGAPDGLGSPNMGMGGGRYEEYLRRLAARLGIADAIRWNGFIEPERLTQEMRKRPHVLVSPSLHSDENFGVAALKSLSIGRPTVLSAWGGHLDFKRNFSSRVTLASVTMTSHGPVLDPWALARKLCRASDRDASAGTEADGWSGASCYEIERVGARLREFALGLGGGGAPLRQSNLARAVFERRSKTLFQGYDDKLARPFLKAYAGNRPRRRVRMTGDKPPLIPPWVSIAGDAILVRDPHRGSFDRPLAGRPQRGATVVDVRGRESKIDPASYRWLVEAGWAFRPEGV